MTYEIGLPMYLQTPKDAEAWEGYFSGINTDGMTEYRGIFQYRVRTAMPVQALRMLEFLPPKPKIGSSRLPCGLSVL